MIVGCGWGARGDARAQDQESRFDDPGQALIRVVHASPDAPALDLYVGDQVVASGLVLGDATGFLPVTDGEMGLRFVPAGGEPETAIVETRFSMVDGGAYEVVALGQLREIDGRIYEIDRTRFEAAGKARLRFLHLSPDAEEVDLLLAGDEPLFEGADFADATGYAEIDAGTYPVSLRSSDPTLIAAGAGAMAAMELDFAPGRVYDMVAIGLTADATFALLPLTATSDLPCGELLGAGGFGDACVRLVHASVDTPPFDVYLDGGETPLVEGLAVAEGSGFVPIPSGTHEVRLVTADGVEGEVLREAKIEVAAGSAYDVAALDLREQLEVRAIGLDLSPLGAGQARLRLVHAMPNRSGLTLAVADGDEIFRDLPFPDVSPSLEVPAEPLDLVVRAAGDEGIVLATEPGYELAPGIVYTVYVIGTGDGVVADVLTLTTPAATASGAPPPTPTAD